MDQLTKQFGKPICVLLYAVFAALAGEGGLKRVKLVTAYPSTEETGVLYIKVASS